VVNIAVLQADECQFGLIVDEVDDTEEIVVKPLGKLLNGLPVYTGATIMGDGSVALILDVLGLAQHAGVIGDAREQKLAGDLSAREIEAQEQRKLLLFQNPDGGSMAIPLSDVTRLETFSLSSIERTGKQQVVQYRGTILPLVHISDLAQESSRQSLALSSQGDDKIQVIVHTQSHRSVGMVVDRIMDIVESDLSARRPPNRRGVLGSIVVQDKVAEILDVDEVIRVHDPTFFAEEPSLRGVA
jgi:two-component system chemotaxis sensor kinase CheA